MSLRALMARDLANVFLDTTAFAETATYTPQDAAGFSLVVCPGDAAPAISGGDGGISQEIRITMTCALADFQTGSPTNPPARGDVLTIATGDMAGTWRVDGFYADSGGGLALYVVRSDQSTIAAAGTRNV